MSCFPDTIRARVPARQNGAVLIVALIFLVLLTILAIGSSSTSLMQSKMVSATRNAQLAHWGAESALRGAEWKLWLAVNDKAVMICGHNPQTSGCYDSRNAGRVPALVRDFGSESGWNSDYKTNAAYTKYDALDYSAVGTGAAEAKLAAEPVYIIEKLGRVRPPGVTSYGNEANMTGGGVGAGGASTTLYLYRVTAHSPGGSTNAAAAMQSVFAAPGI